MQVRSGQTSAPCAFWSPRPRDPALWSRCLATPSLWSLWPTCTGLHVGPWASQVHLCLIATCTSCSLCLAHASPDPPLMSFRSVMQCHCFSGTYLDHPTYNSKIIIIQPRLSSPFLIYSSFYYLSQAGILQDLLMLFSASICPHHTEIYTAWGQRFLPILLTAETLAPRKVPNT